MHQIFIHYFNTCLPFALLPCRVLILHCVASIFCSASCEGLLERYILNVCVLTLSLLCPRTEGDETETLNQSIKCQIVYLNYAAECWTLQPLTSTIVKLT